MSNIGMFGVPGATAATFTFDAELFWGGDESRIEILRLSKQYSSAMADAANTPTTVVRKGMLIGMITATKLYKQWDPAATDGSQIFAGVLGVELVMIDQFGTAVAKHAPLIVKAPVKASALKILGAALVGHASEYAARAALARAGFRLDDDPVGAIAGAVLGLGGGPVVTKATNYTVLAADNGTTFVQITADAVFTLPTIAAGLRYEFLQSADFEMSVAGAAGSMLVGGDAAANSVTWTTAGQQIGARLVVEAMNINGTLKWVPYIKVAPYGDGTALLAHALAT